MTDPVLFRGNDSARTDSALDCFAITPHASNDFTYMVRGIYVGVAGDVVVVTPSGAAVTFKGATAGSILPVKAKRVNATSTTATDLVGLY